jgi:hypothetical protein
VALLAHLRLGHLAEYHLSFRIQVSPFLPVVVKRAEEQEALRFEAS